MHTTRASKQAKTGPEMVDIDGDGRRFAVSVDGIIRFTGSREECEKRLEILSRQTTREHQDKSLGRIFGTLLLAFLAGALVPRGTEAELFEPRPVFASGDHLYRPFADSHIFGDVFLLRASTEPSPNRLNIPFAEDRHAVPTPAVVATVAKRVFSVLLGCRPSEVISAVIEPVAIPVSNVGAIWRLRPVERRANHAVNQPCVVAQPDGKVFPLVSRGERKDFATKPPTDPFGRYDFKRHSANTTEAAGLVPRIARNRSPFLGVEIEYDLFSQFALLKRVGQVLAWGSRPAPAPHFNSGRGRLPC